MEVGLGGGRHVCDVDCQNNLEFRGFCFTISHRTAISSFANAFTFCASSSADSVNLQISRFLGRDLNFLSARVGCCIWLSPEAQFSPRLILSQRRPNLSLRPGSRISKRMSLAFSRFEYHVVSLSPAFRVTVPSRKRHHNCCVIQSPIRDFTLQIHISPICLPPSERSRSRLWTMV